ncbi:hypothetical protein AVEN_9175-1 [Araneus ventricosus]|uniref:Uncharacterized protein n=1 Tax=Araneus ventricosus TaxID=182803 RepID=A0A4Y2V2E3_ARAVE|nr:hypothetical protein AVEN_9175-1 [Araneus ventricosus]
MGIFQLCSRSWEASLSTFSGCPHLPHGSIGDGDMLGIFLLPEALLQTFFRNKRLWMFAEKIYISPVECASRKFCEAHVLVRHSEVWVKIPKQCVIEARLSVGSFTRFEVTFGYNRSPYPFVHAHVDAVNIFFESASSDSFEGPGAQYLEVSWKRLEESIAEGRSEFLIALQELLCFYDAFY